jgi:hypothetical protein
MDSLNIFRTDIFFVSDIIWIQLALPFTGQIELGSICDPLY